MSARWSAIPDRPSSPRSSRSTRSTSTSTRARPWSCEIKEALAKQGKTVLEIQQVPVEVGLQTEDGYPHKGHIDYVAPNVDASTGTLQVRAVFDNKDVTMLPGLFVRVRVPVQKVDDSLLVADAAVGTNQLGEYLLVLGKDNVVEQRQVTLGQLDGGLRVIESGLKPDDWVITEGIQRAIPGNTVDAAEGDHDGVRVGMIVPSDPRAATPGRSR